MLDRLSTGVLLLLPGAALVFFSFNAGGFFPGSPALVAVVLLLLLVSRLLVAAQPFAGFGRPLAIAAGALGVYTLWSLLSGTWSDSSWRAVVEFDRGLLYLLALVLYGSMPRESWRVRWIGRGVALGILVVCACGLITRLAPDLWPIGANLTESRLSYPITYWNSLGLLSAIGAILCFHFACSRSESAWVRVLAAGSFPVLATVLLLTFSRGAILTGAIGLVAYVLLGRPRALLSGALATLPAASVAVLFAYRADLIVGTDPTGSAAIAQGHNLAIVIGLCVILALWLRWLALPLDKRVDDLPPLGRPRPAALGALAAAGVAATVALALTLDAPGYVADQYDLFLNNSNSESRFEPRARLTDPGNNGRVELWRVAVEDGFRPAVVKGTGAGTYELVWTENRPARAADLTVADAHSLYAETLSDLGLVGLLSVLVALLTVLYGFAARLWGPHRSFYAALLAAGLAWALHAGIDWDWEMPAVTLWLFALGGAALAVPARDAPTGPSMPPAVRAGLAGALVLIGFVPALVTISQGRLDAAARAFIDEGDCALAIEEARRSHSALPLRPEPYRLEGYCQARQGRTREAVDSMWEAVERDPGNWEYRYSLAVAQAAAGSDPRPAARQALRLNPEGEATQDLIERFPTSEPRRWREEAVVLLEEPVF